MEKKSQPEPTPLSTESLLDSIIDAQPEVQRTVTTDNAAPISAQILLNGQRASIAEQASRPPFWKDGTYLPVTSVTMVEYLSETTQRRSLLVRYWHGETLLSQEWLSPYAPERVLVSKFLMYGMPRGSVSGFVNTFRSTFDAPKEVVNPETLRLLGEVIKELLKSVKGIGVVVDDKGFDRITTYSTAKKVAPRTSGSVCFCGDGSCNIGHFIQRG